MTSNEILAAVKASDELRQAAEVGDDAKIAEILSTSLPSIPKPGTFIGERGIYTVLGAEAGEVFLQTVEGLAASDDVQLAPFKRIARWLKDDIGLDIGNATAQATLQAMTPANGGPFAPASVTAIVAYGSQSQSVSVDEVSAALAPHRQGVTDNETGEASNGAAGPINWEAI